MKTVEEILRECVTHEFDIRNDEYEKGRIIDAMKQYAIEVAKEALKNASLRDGCIFADGERYVHHSLVADENNIPKL